MRINQAGLDLIKSFEGFSPTPYYCAGGELTIGYGHTKTTKEGMKVTREEAEHLLWDDVREAEKTVRSQVIVPLTENQFSALVSLVYNLGGAPLRGTLGTVLNKGRYLDASEEFEKWVYAGGKILKGLQRRRKAEKELFLKDAKSKSTSWFDRIMDRMIGPAQPGFFL